MTTMTQRGMISAKTATYRFRCEGVTGRARQCRREATRHFERSGACVRHYCAQHARGGGVMSLLLPRPWEYDTVTTSTVGG